MKLGLRQTQNGTESEKSTEESEEDETQQMPNVSRNLPCTQLTVFYASNVFLSPLVALKINLVLQENVKVYGLV